jgi:hypothetical protein
MGDILFDNETTPGTPAASKSYLWIDATTKRLMQTDDGGVHRGILGKTATVATQALGSAADTYITDSGIPIPSSGLQARMLFRWHIGFLQTATANTFVVRIRVGTAKTTSDTDISNTLATTVTNGATAGGGNFTITYIVHTIGASGTGVVGYNYQFGVTTIQSADNKTSTTYDNTARGGQFIGISLTPSGTSSTVNGVHGELIS